MRNVERLALRNGFVATNVRRLTSVLGQSSAGNSIDNQRYGLSIAPDMIIRNCTFCPVPGWGLLTSLETIDIGT